MRSGRAERPLTEERPTLIRVATISNSTLVHDLICDSIEQQVDMRFVGSIPLHDLPESGPFVNDILQQCDVLLIHLYSLEMPILTLLRQIAAAVPTVSSLVFGLESDVQLILSCFESGATAYSLEEDSIVAVLDQIRATWRGEPIIAPALAAALIARVAELAANQRQQSKHNQSRLMELTEREQDVLHLLKRGYSNRAIAEELILEIGTVKNHVHHILQKLNVSSRRAAVRYARLVET